ADDSAVDAELAQHRRRDLARVRALAFPVHVLRRDRELGLGELADGRRERDVRRADGDVDALQSRKSRLQPPTELRRLLRALGELPVAGAPHPARSYADAIAATPGSSLPHTTSRAGPP